MLFLEKDTTMTTTATLPTMETNLENQSKDEVDFVKTATNNITTTITNNHDEKQSQTTTTNSIAHTNTVVGVKLKAGTLFGDVEARSCPVKSSLSSLEKLHIFNFPSRKKSDPSPANAKKEKPQFVKSASIARIFGNNYNTKKSEPVHTGTKKIAERFKPTAQETTAEHVEIKREDFCDGDRDLSAKAIRSLSRGIGRLLRRRSHSVDISEPDPEFKVAYLGNVLTGWAKGDGCVEKPLATLWRNYTQNSKPDVVMKVRVCPSGLKATTKQHGLTEYWSHRISYCTSPRNYPRVFCWVYRHEGRKLKHEMRCHAVLCSKESVAREIGKKLQENIARALSEFKRDKISKQNARLSLANSVYDNPTMPRRKIMLSVGGNNYRPPLERSKSAPKLMSIEENIEEEDEEEDEEEMDGDDGSGAVKVKKIELAKCCKESSLYPAMTLGRKRCRRGHSFRRVGSRRGMIRKKVTINVEETETEKLMNNTAEHNDDENDIDYDDEQVEHAPEINSRIPSVTSQNSDEDFVDMYMRTSFDDDSEPLEAEIMQYFDMKLKPVTTTSLVDLTETRSVNQPNSNNSVMLRNSQSLDDLDSYNMNNNNDDDDDLDDRRNVDDDVFFNQDDILDILRKRCSNGEITDDVDDETNAINNNVVSYAGHNFKHFKSVSEIIENDLSLSESFINNSKNMTPEAAGDSGPSSLLCGNSNIIQDSDEGSISSGCETSSTVTTTNDGGCGGDGQQSIQECTSSRIVILEPVGEKIQQPTMIGLRKRVEFHRSTKFIHHTSKGFFSISDSMNSDEEFSDESGYVEEQENRMGKIKPGIV